MGGTKKKSEEPQKEVSGIKNKKFKKIEERLKKQVTDALKEASIIANAYVTVDFLIKEHKWVLGRDKPVIVEDVTISL